MSSKITAVKAKVPSKGIARLIFWKEMQKIGAEIVKDFESTVATWKHKPIFELKTSTAQNTPSLEISVLTDDPIFGWVDEGTKPHIIVPVKAKRLFFSVGGSPKTQPNLIGSSSGSPGNAPVVALVVHHPGTKARNFTVKIENKWRGEFGKRMLAVMKDVRKEME